jgi:hypothetical protein
MEEERTKMPPPRVSEDSDFAGEHSLKVSRRAFGPSASLPRIKVGLGLVAAFFSGLERPESPDIRPTNGFSKSCENV